MKLLAAFTTALFALLPFAAAAEEPEAAYGTFHRAILTGDIDGMLRYVPGAQRSDLARLSPEQKSAQLKSMAALMPRTFALKSKNMEPSGRGARLLVTGPSRVLVGNKAEPLYGEIRMTMEGSDWKVADMNWSDSPPEGLETEPQADLKPAPAPKPAAAAQKSAPGTPSTAQTPAAPNTVQTPAAPRNAAPIVGSMDAAPARKLGTAKPTCVYKPVMTAEDLELCR